MAVPAALASFFAGFAIGIPGFLRFAQATASRTGDLVLQASHEVNAGRLPGDVPVVAWHSAALALPSYLLTPGGLLAAYLVASGIFRGLCAAADDPRGDVV